MESNWLPAPEGQVDPDAAALLAQGVGDRQHLAAAGGEARHGNADEGLEIGNGR